MTPQTDNFRILIILSLATWIVGTYVSYNAAPPPPELAQLYGWQGYGEVVPGLITLRLYWVESALTVLGMLGMFFFLNMGRWLVFASIVLNPVRTAVGGIWVSSPLEDTFWSLHWVFFMFAVGMAFFSGPIEAKFRRAAHPSSQAAAGAEQP